MNPFFSIIIPTYNRCYCIGNAIQSVIDQTFNDWELIIIDDGSTDKTKSVVESFSDSRIKYYWQQNKQLNGARNSGVNNAKGEYICFLDDDDLFKNNHLSVHFQAIKDNQFPKAILHSGMESTFKNINILSEDYNLELHKNPILYQWNIGMNLLPLSIHRKIFESVKFDERFILWDDAHFLIRALLSFPFYQIPSAYTSIYFITPQSRSQTYISKDKVENSIECIKDVYTNHSEKLNQFGVNKNDMEEEISKTYLHNAHNALNHKLFGLGYEYFFKAIKHKKSLKNWRRYLIFPPKSFVYWTSNLLFRKELPKPKL